MIFLLTVLKIKWDISELEDSALLGRLSLKHCEPHWKAVNKSLDGVRKAIKDLKGTACETGLNGLVYSWKKD